MGYPSKSKSEVSTIFPIFHKLISTQFGVKIQTLRSDYGKEYFNNDLTTYLQNEGIVHQSSCVDTPQLNVVAKSKSRHLLEVVKSLLFQMKVSKIYEGKVILTTIYLINRMSSQVLAFKYSINTILESFPDFQGIVSLPPKIYGCYSFVHVHNHNLRSKHDPKTLKCIFLGYSHTQKGYKCYHPPNKRKCITMDVTFIGNKPYFFETSSRGE